MKLRKNKKKGFSLVELVVVIAILAIMTAVLAPSLLSYVERSRAQKDVSAMDEVTNSVFLSMADMNVYDELVANSLPENVSCYIDTNDEADHEANKVITKRVYNWYNKYTFNDNSRLLDETKYYAAGNMRGVTITFSPNPSTNESGYVLADGVVNEFLTDGTTKLVDMPYVYNAMRQVMGDVIKLTSQTYRNSDYTIFIKVGSTGGNQASSQDAIEAYGQYSGTNLPADEIKYSVATGRDVKDPNEGVELPENDNTEVTTEQIEVPGLGMITVKNPNNAEFTYNSSTGILLGATRPGSVTHGEVESTIPLIEFTAGTFEANTKYTPGEYELESYTVTKTRAKKPVACKGGIIISCIYVGNETFQAVRPTADCLEYESTYIAYSVARSGATTVNGFVPYHLNYRTIANAEDDTLENAIYIAAYTQQIANHSWNVAKWNGSFYEDVYCRSEIDAITDFTETYAETMIKKVMITEPSSSTEYVYVPGGTMKAEKDMTWAEWLESEYNTFDFEITTVWDANFNEISLDSKIVAGESYGFAVVEGEIETSGFPITWNSMEVIGNASVQIGDGVFLVKFSDFVPHADDIKNMEMYGMGERCSFDVFSSTDGCIILSQSGADDVTLVLIYAPGEYMIYDDLFYFPERGCYMLDLGSLGLDVDFTIDLVSSD